MNVKQLERFIDEMIDKIKAEAHKRITAEYPIHEQINALANATRIQNKELVAIKSGKAYRLTTREKSSLRKAGDMDNIITKIRNKSDKIERIFLELTVDEMTEFNPSEHKHWRGEKHGRI